MHAKTRPNRALSLFLILAMLVTLFAALLPVAVSAGDPEPEAEEIQDFGYQSSADFTIGGKSTDLRFLFTIGSLDYDEVGFVFSFEDFGDVATPTVGGAGCYKVGTQTVYTSITADGKKLAAPNGRWWVAAKVTNIPQNQFCSWIHVRAFVTKNAETTYSDAVKINPYQANRGDGEKISELYTKKSDKSTHYFNEFVNVYKDVLDKGAECFHPTNDNPTGNDLLIEYSVLWNNSIANFNKSTTKSVKSYLCDAGDHTKQAPLAYWSPLDGIEGNDCQYAGGFEWCGSFVTPISDGEVTTPAGMVSADGDYADYPNVTGADQNNPEYGWHRIGLRYHEEVTNADALKTDLTPGATPAVYALTMTIYVDGVAIAKLGASDCTTGSDRDCKLYTAQSDGAGGIVYTDIGSDVDLCIFEIAGQNAGSKTAVFVVAEPYASCGKNFVQTVERVDSPTSFYYRDGGNTGRLASTYYRVADDSFPDSISLMSYNIEIYGGTSGDRGWDGRDPAKVAETILSESPDIVGLQEVNQGQSHGWNDTLDSLAAAGGYTRLEGEYTGRYDFEKNEIFYKTSKFTKLAEGTKTFKQAAIDLSVPNDESADQSLDNVDRIFHYAALQETSSGKKILVVNTHLHYGGTGEGHEADDKLRRYEIRTLLAWLETQRATYPNQIVMGDMNSHYKTGQGKVNMELFRDAGFARTVSSAGVKYDVGGTLSKSSRSARDQWIFDYILTRGSIDTAYYTVVPNPIDEGGKYPSDHVPILAKIYVR